MKYLDLFSGIGGFSIAMKKVFPSHDNVGHSEIDKNACKIYHTHFKESKCLGDITKIDKEILKKVGNDDLLITAGFP